MGNAIVESFIGQLKDLGDGTFGSAPAAEPPAGLYDFVGAANDEDTLQFVDGANTVSWDKPLLLGNGGAIPASTITGYRVYKKVGEDRYAVATDYVGGQSILSDSILKDDWLDNLPTPTGANTVSGADSVSAIQAAVAALTPGDTLYFSDTGGDIVFPTTGTGPIGFFLSCTQSGLDGNRINLVAVPGESPVIRGAGWVDDDVGPAGNQTLIDVSGDFWRLYGIEIADSTKYGVNLHGNDAYMAECNAHDCWSNNIVVGDENVGADDCTGVVVEFNKAHHSRVGAGIAIILEAGTSYNVDNITIRRNLVYRNGFRANSTPHPFMGGNSDGIVVFKLAHTDYIPGSGPLDPGVTGRENRMRDFKVLQNISLLNGDDGIDVSSGNGTIIQGNFVLKNGPSGNKGYKIFAEIYERQKWVCNASIGDNSDIFIGDGILYYKDLVSGQSFSPGDVIVGSLSGATCTVNAVTVSTNVGDEGFLEVSGVSGNFQSDDVLRVSAVDIAEVFSLGQTAGFEGRVNDSEATRSFGIVDSVGWTSINHDLPGAFANRGLTTPIAPGTTPDQVNLLSFGNKSVDNLGGGTPLTSLINTGGVTPDLENLGSFPITETFTGATIQDQWRNLYRQLQAHIMPINGGNCYNTGTVATSLLEYYHQNAADDPDRPSPPEDNTKAIWTNGGVDIGAVAHQYLLPPVLTSVV